MSMKEASNMEHTIIVSTIAAGIVYTILPFCTDIPETPASTY
jgi:hypothetical protein